MIIVKSIFGEYYYNKVSKNNNTKLKIKDLKKDLIKNYTNIKYENIYLFYNENVLNEEELLYDNDRYIMIIKPIDCNKH